jgi:7-carboxy-7-deazaguanine synthase
MISVCEQFKSIQGESTFAGMPCSFIRLSGCNLSCTYCDTRYAADPGTPLSVEAVVDVVAGHGVRLAEVTGGEPLLQEETPELCRRLLDKGYTVLVETNGSLDISALPAGCIRVMDVKCPSSGMAGSFHASNIDSLGPADEVKFVISGADDFAWALQFALSRGLTKRCTVIFSPVQGRCAARELSQWILDTSAPVRLGLQLHHYIWGADARGH